MSEEYYYYNCKVMNFRLKSILCELASIILHKLSVC